MSDCHNPCIRKLLTSSAGSLLEKQGLAARLDNLPLSTDVAVGDRVRLRAGDREAIVLKVIRRTWADEAGQPTLEILLDWPER